MNKTIEKFIPMADMIAETFGADCEVVLHDLDDPEHSVVHVSGNHVTGRQIGESFDMLVKDVMLSPKLKDGYVSNYFFTAKNGKLIRSSTMLISDDTGRTRGALCINIDTTRTAEQIQYLSAFLPEKETRAENSIAGSDHIRSVVEDLIGGIMHGTDPDKMSRDEKIEKIRFMDGRGIFLMKGSVEMVADAMHVNKVTVYSYLDEARGKRG